ncbi:transposase [Komagataeibacter medellinensis]|uniref:Transposase n=1 Tax=Komagataeibacter medellinensis TaxID=1177712 RepID=A0ABQ6VRH2_9PROT|nr:transposase [Komagataeibacter medellinensis]
MGKENEKSVLREIRRQPQTFTGSRKAGRALPSGSSPVEGQISRLKMIKRTMSGRAGLELIRARVFSISCGRSEFSVKINTLTLP